MADFNLNDFLKALQENPEAMQQIRQVLDAPAENPYTPVTPEQKVQHFTKLITHGLKEPKPYVHQVWPTTMFHPSKPCKVVQNEAAARLLGPEWATSPFEDVVPDEMAEPEAVAPVRRGPGRPKSVSQ